MSINSPHTETEAHKELYSTSFLHLNDVPNHGILLCDQKGYIIDANKIFCDLLVLSLSDIKDKHISSDVCLKMGLQQVSACFEDFLTVGVATCKREFTLKNNTKLFLEINIRVVSSENIGFFIKNISEECKLKADLQEARTALKVLNKDNNRFISILSHDLKSPFNTILGFAELLKANFKFNSLEKNEKYISLIQNSSQKAYNLLEDTLVWAGSKSGKFNVAKCQFIINNLVLEVVSDLNTNAIFKNINIQLSQGPQISVFCDPRIIKIVLRNLLSNAIKYTNTGGSIIVHFEQNDLEVLVSVSDNGIGIDPDLMSKLFKMTSINSTIGTGNEKGTGIGLIICKELIEKHEGKIWVTSELGTGSDFKFTIPKESSFNA